MVPRCQTLQKFPRHFSSDCCESLTLFFFFSQDLYIYKIQRSTSSWWQVSCKMNCPADTGSGDIFFQFPEQSALRELWCYKQLNLSYWNTSNFQQSWRRGKCFLPWISCMPGLLFSSCHSQRIHLPLPSGPFGLNSLFVTSFSSLLCLLSWNFCS